ncbi:MAG TPA: NAD(P)H-hydrate epimerase, partial [Flavisolibacter sp.]|nr:NAD(P)H-hydrate epimerase [Flavisolibacter sp.]
MNILTAAQMKAWDEYTMQHEPIASIDLMERAAQKVVEWIEQRNWKTRTIRIFCGRGNNGGDGLAVGRILLQKGYNCFVYVIQNRRTGSPDFEANLKRIQTSSNNNVRFIAERNQLPFIEKDAIIIDALFGSGLNKPVEGLNASVVDHLNRSGATIVSVDVPTGLFANEASKGQQIIEADFTLTFQSYKPALLIQENAAFIGNVHLLDIGLHPQFTPGTTDILIDDDLVRSLYRPRGRFAHKGNFGHALLIAGSFGKMGAAVLAAKACLRAGVGLLSCFLPRCGYTIMQAAVPEAMVMVDENETNIGQLPEEIEKYSVIGIGPGIGTAETTQKMITFIVRRYRKPLVLDADALNCLSL